MPYQVGRPSSPVSPLFGDWRPYRVGRPSSASSPDLHSFHQYMYTFSCGCVVALAVFTFIDWACAIVISCPDPASQTAGGLHHRYARIAGHEASAIVGMRTAVAAAIQKFTCTSPYAKAKITLVLHAYSS